MSKYARCLRAIFWRRTLDFCGWGCSSWHLLFLSDFPCFRDKLNVCILHLKCNIQYFFCSWMKQKQCIPTWSNLHLGASIHLYIFRATYLTVRVVFQGVAHGICFKVWTSCKERGRLIVVQWWWSPQQVALLCVSPTAEGKGLSRGGTGHGWSPRLSSQLIC